MHLALLHNRLRVEERLLLDAFESLHVRIDPIDVRAITLDREDTTRWRAYDLILDRTLSLTDAVTTVRFLESIGLRCVNPAAAIDLCSDKLRTSLALHTAGIPTPRFRTALSRESALAAIESLGYPVVIKPTIGSWGRMVSRLNDRDAAEAILEHLETLGSPHHRIYYIQEFIHKPGRDLRVFIIGGEPIAGITRTSAHWLTNTARGAVASGLTITPDIDRICRSVYSIIPADCMAIDLLECPDRGLLINEVNHSMEFRNSIETTGVDIPRLFAEHVRTITAGLERTEVTA